MLFCEGWYRERDLGSGFTGKFLVGILPVSCFLHNLCRYTSGIVKRQVDDLPDDYTKMYLKELLSQGHDISCGSVRPTPRYGVVPSRPSAQQD